MGNVFFFLPLSRELLLELSLPEISITFEPFTLSYAYRPQSGVCGRATFIMNVSFNAKM